MPKPSENAVLFLFFLSFLSALTLLLFQGVYVNIVNYISTGIHSTWIANTLASLLGHASGKTSRMHFSFLYCHMGGEEINTIK